MITLLGYSTFATALTCKKSLTPKKKAAIKAEIVSLLTEAPHRMEESGRLRENQKATVEGSRGVREKTKEELDRDIEDVLGMFDWKETLSQSSKIDLSDFRMSARHLERMAEFFPETVKHISLTGSNLITTESIQFIISRVKGLEHLDIRLLPKDVNVETIVVDLQSYHSKTLKHLAADRFTDSMLETMVGFENLKSLDIRSSRYSEERRSDSVSLGGILEFLAAKKINDRGGHIPKAPFKKLTLMNVPNSGPLLTFLNEYKLPKTLIDYRTVYVANRQNNKIQIEKVVDGDTINAAIEDVPGIWARIPWRLEGLDSAEASSQSSALRKLDEAAQKFIKSHLDKADAIVFSFEGAERYGRNLGTLRVMIGEQVVNVNKGLIAEGLVLPYGGKTKAKESDFLDLFNNNIETIRYWNSVEVLN